MLRVHIPDGEDMQLQHLVMDVNGTLSDRGALIGGVAQRLDRLREHLTLHVLSADTFGTAEPIASDFGAQLRLVRTGAEKRAYVERLGADRCVAIGNGANDRAMLEAAVLGIAVLGPEGAHVSALTAATVVCRSILEALDLLLAPQALTATLRT